MSLRQLPLRLLSLTAVLLLVSFGTFGLVSLLPGDPAVAILGESATPERVAEIHAELGLDRPIIERYVHWLGDAVQGDFGRSLVPPVQDVREMIFSRLPITVEIAAMATFIAVATAIPVGVLGAHRERGRFDTAANAASFAVLSMPAFLVALLLIFATVFHPLIARVLLAAIGAGIVVGITGPRLRSVRSNAADRGIATLGLVIAGLLLAVAVRWFPEFPRTGFSRLTDRAGVVANLKSVFLPALTLGIAEAAVLSRVVRNDMLATLNETFILAARAAGTSPRRLLFRDALRPSLFSVLTIVGVSLGRLLGGTVIVEAVFNIQGIGSLLVNSISVKDFGVVQGIVLIIATTYVVLNAAVDLLYGALDPRIRHDTH